MIFLFLPTASWDRLALGLLDLPEGRSLHGVDCGKYYHDTEHQLHGLTPIGFKSCQWRFGKWKWLCITSLICRPYHCMADFFLHVTWCDIMYCLIEMKHYSAKSLAQCTEQYSISIIITASCSYWSKYIRIACIYGFLSLVCSSPSKFILTPNRPCLTLVLYLWP